MKHVLSKCCEVSKHGHQITWDFPAYGVCEKDQEALTHKSYIVNEGLSCRGYQTGMGFKIGISYKPYDRFTKYVDYKFLQSMVLTCVSEIPHRIADLEILAISHFRNDHRCKNKKPGGESALKRAVAFFHVRSVRQKLAI